MKKLVSGLLAATLSLPAATHAFELKSALIMRGDDGWDRVMHNDLFPENGVVMHVQSAVPQELQDSVQAVGEYAAATRGPINGVLTWVDKRSVREAGSLDAYVKQEALPRLAREFTRQFDGLPDGEYLFVYREPHIAIDARKQQGGYTGSFTAQQTGVLYEIEKGTQ